MRIFFYLVYRANPKLAPMVREIGWSHNLILLERCKDDLEREFYLRLTRRPSLRGVARANDADGGAYYEPFRQVPQGVGVKRFALVCPGKNKAKVWWSQQEVGFQATIIALVD